MQSEKKLELALGPNHHSYHLLCKSHTVETLVRSNLNVLAEVEKSVKQGEIFEDINPPLVEADIEALLNFITHGKSGRSWSEADLFDDICVRERITKIVFLYQQRRFTKLGKAASVLMDAKDFLTILLDKVEATN